MKQGNGVAGVPLFDSCKGVRMEEIRNVVGKYDASYIKEHLESADDVTRFATIFYKDVAEVYDTITRVKNVERNPTGYSLTDAPILGLLVRIWKLLKEVIRYYEENNAEFIGILARPLLEAATTARFLLSSSDAVLEDYRKCSYKDRLRILRDLKKGSPFFETKAGKRLLSSVQDKMRLEQLTEADFQAQKKNRWRLQGKTFYDIFSSVEDEQIYSISFGMMSESIHGSWNDSMDFCLVRNPDNTFSTFPFYHPADIRYVSPILRFCNPGYRGWLMRTDAYDEALAEVLDWIQRVNTALFLKFDSAFDGP